MPTREKYYYGGVITVDLSLQDSGPFLCKGGSSEPTEPPLATGLTSYVRSRGLGILVIEPSVIYKLTLELTMPK